MKDSINKRNMTFRESSKAGGGGTIFMYQNSILNNRERRKVL